MTLDKPLLAMLMSLHAAVCFAAAAPSAPDLILAHGKILTVDSRDSVAQALAVRNGIIVAVGSDRRILAMATGATRIVDLKGRTATPGLIDTHAHVADGGLQELYQVKLGDAGSIADVAARVRKAAAAIRPGEWLQGAGWDEGKLAERRYVLAADLDPAAPANPVLLVHTTGHYAVANSAALALAKITADTPNPAAGTIDRAADGSPTGVLKEAAVDLVARLIPDPTPEQRRAGILHSVDLMLSEGMTAVKDPAIDLATFEAYESLLDAGKLRAHVCVLWAAGRTLESATAVLALIQARPKPPASLGDGRLLSCGAKIFMDGSGGARTAWMSQDWNKNSTDTDTGNRGYPTTDPDVYRQQVALFHRAGIHIGTHAIGDRAIDNVVDTYAAVLREMPTRGTRDSIIHANIPSDHAIATMAMLQHTYDAGYPEAQAPFVWWIGDTYAANFGSARAQRLMPFKTYLARSVRWSGGSDYPVTPLPARFGLWASVRRETLKGTYGEHAFGTAESIDVHQALRSYTAWSAPQLFLERQIGTLQVGKDADIAVWDRDPYSIPGSELRNLHCEMTFLHGEIVYQSAGETAN